MYLFSLIYNAVLIILSVLLLPVILIALAAVPKFRAGFFTKLGFYKFEDGALDHKKYTIFFHAVSVGEVNAIEGLVKRTREEFQDANIVLSTTTRTGQEIANKKLKNTVNVITYFPFDYFLSVQSFLKTVKPDSIVIAETEIWPDFVYLAKRKDIPVYIVNGRLSPNSYKGYKKFSFFFKPVLEQYEGIFMQTQGDVERITDVGAMPEITKFMGNLKFDIQPNLDAAQIEALAQDLSLVGTRLITAASTHAGEDEIVLGTFKTLKKEFPDIKLLIAPRHPERYGAVEELLQKSGFHYGRRSNAETFQNNDIIMLDTMGELMKMFAVSYLAFIGGSFAKTGGHNPLEANIWGKPVVSGDCVFNFKDIYAFLTKSDAAKLSSTPEELTQDIRKLLSDRDFYEKASKDTQKIFQENRGAIDFVIKELKN